MKASAALLITVVFLAALVAASSVAANGSPYSPGLAHGWDGVLDARREVRYVSISAGGSTVVAAIRVPRGRVLRTRTVRGQLGIPYVAYDGTTGGLSGDGRALVLASYGPQPGASGVTTFTILATKTLKVRRFVELPGSWSFDAISPDGRTLYLVEHLAPTPEPKYRVRLYDIVHGRLLRGAVVDRLAKTAVMGGQPVTRATSPDGRWAYTLYARTAADPFVHALDTQRSQAVCIGLPVSLSEVEQWGLRLRLRSQGALVVRRGASTVAVVDTRTFAVRDR